LGERKKKVVKREENMKNGIKRREKRGIGVKKRENILILFPCLIHVNNYVYVYAKG